MIMNGISDHPDNGIVGSGLEDEVVSAETDMNDWLRQLRLRRMQPETVWLPADEEPGADEADETVSETIAEDAPEEAEDDAAEDEIEADPELQLGETLDEMSNEIRRLGREIFKTNRAADRNTELFSEALTEIRQLSTVIAQVPAQNAAQLSDAQFEAKATICRELLRLTDTFEASLHAADEVVVRLQSKTAREPQGLAFRFAATRDLHATLAESALALRQWSEGQRLLAARLQTVLQTAGVRAIDTLGRAFDPALHRAVAVAQRNDLTPGTIVGEELKGYVLDGRILRYAEVVVARYE